MWISSIDRPLLEPWCCDCDRNVAMHRVIVEALWRRARNGRVRYCCGAHRPDQDADQFVLRAVERLAGATFRSDGTSRKTTKCDIEKLTPKAATIETNFATNT